MKALGSILVLVSCLAVTAAEVIPPLPRQWFNDYAGVLTPAAAGRLNKTLEDLERETSNQILVALFQKMQSESSIEDYTVRVAQAWKIGQKNRNNGAVLFVFIQDRKMFIQVGYGLEGALPDALCKRIIEDEIKPRFRNNDFDGGMSAGVTALLAATKGEYKGTGQTASAQRGVASRPLRFFPFLFLCLAALVVLMRVLRFINGAGGRVYRRGGWYQSGTWGGGGWSGSSGNWGGGGGGFSSGGGSFGGGGAGGSW